MYLFSRKQKQIIFTDFSNQFRLIWWKSVKEWNNKHELSLTIQLRNLHRRFDVYLVSVKSTVKTLSFFVAFLENMNFNNVWRAAYS